MQYNAYSVSMNHRIYFQFKLYIRLQKYPENRIKKLEIMDDKSPLTLCKKEI